MRCQFFSRFSDKSIFGPVVVRNTRVLHLCILIVIVNSCQINAQYSDYNNVELDSSNLSIDNTDFPQYYDNGQGTAYDNNEYSSVGGQSTPLDPEDRLRSSPDESAPSSSPDNGVSYYPVFENAEGATFSNGTPTENSGDLIVGESHLPSSDFNGFEVPEIPNFYLPFPAPKEEAHLDYDYPLKDAYHQTKLDFWEGLSLLTYGVFGGLTKEVSLVVILFLSFYVIFAFFFKDIGHLLQQPKKCDSWGWDGFPEWEFHAPARFVPAVPMDQYMQAEFLSLFRILKQIKDKKKDDDSGSSSSEEDYSYAMDVYSPQIDHINEMCPHDAFFYGLAPHHIIAYTTLQRMFVEQPSPKEVLHLAKSTLLSGKVNPKVWYLGLLAASMERPDMTGFALAHPLDAMPDLFVAAHLIEEEFEDKWRLDQKIFLMESKRHGAKKGNSTYALKNVKGKQFKNNIRTNSTYKVKKSGSKPDKPKHRITREIPPLIDLATVFNSTALKMDAPTLKNTRISRMSSTTTTSGTTSTTTTTTTTTTTSKKPEIVTEKSTTSTTTPIPTTSTTQAMNSTILTARQGEIKLPPPQKDPVFPANVSPGNYKGETAADDKSGKNKKNEKNKKGDKNKKGKKGKKDEKKCVVMDGSIGLDNGYENALWYFREDMMLNQHHLYWHQVYPPNATRHGNRRSELFFYMHRAMLARYNAERLSNGFARTYEQELKHGSIIAEGYNSHLADVNARKFWTPRPPNTPIVDAIHIDDPDFAKNILIEEIHAIIKRFLRGFQQGKLLAAKGGFVPIRQKNGFGIDPIGNTMEASELSINPLYYNAFGLHNMGHIIIALAVDPEFKARIPTGIMSEAAVSMRDPVFYTYHTIIDNLFERYKETLPPYQITKGPFPLLWNGVEVVDVEIISKTGGHMNEIRTFYSQRRFELGGGVDGSVDRGGKVDVCATHLDHEPFQFKIVIDRKPCAVSKSNMATVRLIMAPRYDEHGERLPLVEQRRLFFPLDTFQVELKVGRNTITRRAADSALTVPWSKSLHQMEQGPDHRGAADYCGCGWPRHLYIPKGNHEGLAFDLFVMITNYDDDFVADDPRDLDIPESCNSAYIFCGRPRRRYPDSKPMGYPFDRPVYQIPTGHFKSRPVETLEEYVNAVPNMALLSFGVKHIEKLFHQKENQKQR